MNLEVNNKKPVVFVKVKTTGFDKLKDRIVELALVKIEEGKDVVSIVTRFNPEVEMSEEVVLVNEIDNESLKDKPLFKDKAEGISKFIKGSDFVGFNVRDFDVPFLISELYRSGIEFLTFGVKFIDLKHFYHKMNTRTFKDAVKQYSEKDLGEKVSSEDFLNESVSLFDGMLKKHNGDALNNGGVVDYDFENLSKEFDPCYGALDIDGRVVLNGEGRPIFSFGKHKDKLVSNVLVSEDPGYLQWILGKDFSPDTKNVLKKIYMKAKSKG